MTHTLITYNIFYIYTYKYTKPSNTLTLSRTQRPHKPTSYKQPDKLYSLTNAERKPFIYGKMHKPHNAPSHTISNLHICGDFEKLHNAFCVSVLSLFCNHIEIFCNLFVIYRAKWVYTCVGKLKIDVIRTYIRPKALAL